MHTGTITLSDTAPHLRPRAILALRSGKLKQVLHNVKTDTVQDGIPVLDITQELPGVRYMLSLLSSILLTPPQLRDH